MPFLHPQRPFLNGSAARGYCLVHDADMGSPSTSPRGQVGPESEEQPACASGIGFSSRPRFPRGLAGHLRESLHSRQARRPPLRDLVPISRLKWNFCTTMKVLLISR